MMPWPRGKCKLSSAITYLVKSLMNKHTAINNSLPVRWWLWQLIIHNWHVIRHNVIWFLKIHFACELFANLVQCLS